VTWYAIQLVFSAPSLEDATKLAESIEAGLTKVNVPAAMIGPGEVEMDDAEEVVQGGVPDVRPRDVTVGDTADAVDSGSEGVGGVLLPDVPEAEPDGDAHDGVGDGGAEQRSTGEDGS
jgi:hypothetical protein